MSDDQPTTEPATQDTPESPPAQAETDWKSEARKWEARAKSNSEAAKRLAEIEEANKTEAQKQADRLAELESTATTATRKALRLEIALDLGLPKSWAPRLQGETEDELRADAQAILADLKQTPAPPVAGPPRERLVPGTSATPPGATPDPKKIAAAVIKGRYV